jgi:hypothetical protein
VKNRGPSTLNCSIQEFCSVQHQVYSYGNIACPRRKPSVKLLGITLLLIGLGSAAFAGALGVPEIAPVSAGSALALIAGAVLVIRGRRKK